MRYDSTTRQVGPVSPRLVYGSPAPLPKVKGSIVVGMQREAACSTAKLGLCWAVPLLGMAALGALPTGVPRVNSDQKNTSKGGFVFQESQKLREAPTVQHRPLRPASPNPVADTVEVLDGYPPPSALGQRDDLFRDAMVDVAGKARFLAREFSQPPLGGTGLFPLEFGPQAAVSAAQTVQRSASVNVSIRVRSDVHDAEITAQEIINIGGIGRFNVAGSSEVEVSLMQDQVRLALSGFEQNYLPGTTRERNLQPAAGGPDVHQAFVNVPLQDAVIVGDGSKRRELALGAAIKLIGVGHLGDGADQDLRRQPKFLFRLVIAQPVKIEGAERLGSPGTFRDPVAARIDPAKSLLESIHLEWCGEQFDLGCQFHVSNSVAHIDPQWKESAIPPPLKGGGLLARGL